MANSTNRHDELRALLERLNLGGMAAVFADLALKAFIAVEQPFYCVTDHFFQQL